MAASVVRTVGSNLGKNLREIRLHLCQTSEASQGPGNYLLITYTAGNFIEQHYVTLKKANPEFPFLIRECSGVKAKLWARYDFGKERSVPLDNMNADQVLKALEAAVNAKP